MIAAAPTGRRRRETETDGEERGRETQRLDKGGRGREDRREREREREREGEREREREAGRQRQTDRYTDKYK